MFRILRNASTTFYRRQALASSYAAAHFGTLSEMFGEVDESVKETPVVYVHGVARTNYIRGWAWQKVLHMRRRAERRKDNEYSIVIDEDDYRTREKEVQKNDDGTDDDSVANDDDDDDADRLDDRYATKKFQPVKDTVLMYEHDHIYTLGRGAKHKSHLTFLNFDSDPDGERTKVSPEEYEFINLSRKRLHPKRQADDRASLYVNSEQLKLVLQWNGEAIAVDSICATEFQPVMAPNGVPCHRVERGGDVTYHGPGQLVVYPMLDLSKPQYRKDLHWYLRNIEQVILDTLADFGIDDCRRDEENIGIWVGEGKIAAIGVNASSWITSHGFAINVNPDLSYYDEEIIIPCGLKGKPVTSMEKETGKVFTVEEVARSVTRNFGNVFNVEIENCEPLL